MELADELQQRRLALAWAADDKCVPRPLRVQQCLGGARDYEALVSYCVTRCILRDLSEAGSSFCVAP